MENHLNNEGTNNERKDAQPKSDAAKLSDKHMSDQDHVITDEEMRNIKIGVTSQTDAPTEQAIKEADDKIADKKMDSEDDIVPGSQKSTPWDVLGP